MEDESIVEAVNKGLSLVLLKTGELCPIVSYYDDEGEETLDTDDALAAVVSLPGGKWVVLDLRAFSYKRMH